MKGINIIDPRFENTNLDLRLIEVTAGINYQVCSVTSTENWKKHHGTELPRELQSNATVSMSSILNFILSNELIFNMHENELLQAVTKAKDGSLGTRIVTEKELIKTRKKEVERLLNELEEGLKAEKEAKEKAEEMEAKKKEEAEKAEKEAEAIKIEAELKAEQEARNKAEKEEEEKERKLKEQAELETKEKEELETKEKEELETKEKEELETKEKEEAETKEKEEAELPEPIYHKLNKQDMVNNPKLTKGFKIGDEVEIDEEGNFLLLNNKLILKITE